MPRPGEDGLDINFSKKSDRSGGLIAPNSVPSTLTLRVENSPSSNESSCTLTNFMLVMPPREPLIEISFDSVVFTQKTGQPHHLSMSGLDAQAGGKAQGAAGVAGEGGAGRSWAQIEAKPTDITARFAVPVPDVAAFSFGMSNLTFGAALRVPFNGDPVSLALGSASRERPFTLTVLMFGGGYIDLELIHTGLRRLKISLQFGAAITINFGIGRAEVHAFGGIRYALVTGGSTVLTGFIHNGGQRRDPGTDLRLGRALHVKLAYQFENNRLVGRATLVIEIDITLFPESVELDSGDWVIAGGEAERSLPPPGPTISRPVRARRAAVDA